MTVPPILYIGLLDVAVDWGDDCLERLFFGRLRSRRTPADPALALSLTRNASSESRLCEVKARESVLGRKNPSLPRGIDRPWTTCYHQFPKVL
jgi:hypothetical protein